MTEPPERTGLAYPVSRESGSGSPAGASGSPAPPFRLLLTPGEAAEALRISQRTLWQLTRDQRVKAVRIGRSVRYAVAALQAFVNGL
jgi:excisionase family DNA binding protein